MIGKEILHAAAPFLAALALSGCGGGSDGSSPASAGGAVAAAALAATASQGESPASGSTVSSGNADAVALQVYGIANGLYGSGSPAAVAIKSLDATPPAIPAIPGVADFTIRRLLALRGAPREVVTKGSQTASQYCGAGGTMAVSIVDADNDGELSSGDSGTLVFSDCKEAGLTVSGTIDFSGLSVTGSAATPTVSVGARFVYRPLSLGNGEETVSVEGGLSLQATIANTAPYTFDLAGAGTALTVRAGGRSMTLSDFSSSARLDSGEGTYAYATQGVLRLDAQGASVTVSSPTPLSGKSGGLPSAGVMVARASDGSATRLTVASPAGVTVETDVDGDGTWEQSQALTWVQFRGR